MWRLPLDSPGAMMQGTVRASRLPRTQSREAMPECIRVAIPVPEVMHMQISDILANMGGAQSIARELGVSEQQASTGVAALLPAILGGFKKQVAAQPNGLDGLGGLLGSLGGGGLLDDVLSTHPTNVNRGNDVLGQIFGSKDVSRAVAQNASAHSGLDPSVLKKMLPIVAMMVAGYMAKQHTNAPDATVQGGGGGLGGILGSLLGGGGNRGGGLASMLDRDGDGNPLDDIIGMMGRK